MTPAKQKRARPIIEPIQTSATALHSLPKKVLTPSRCSLCAASPSSSRILLEIASPPTSAAPGRCITPLSLESETSSPSLPGLDEPDALERPAEAPSTDSPALRADGLCCARCGALVRRRQPGSAVGASTRNVAQFQRYREMLWRAGHKQFGNADHDAYFVVPEEMRHARVAGAREDPIGELSPVTNECRLPVRAVIRTRDGKPIGLKREFDLRELRATIPEPLPSPCSPNFDRSSLLAPFSPLLPPAAAAAAAAAAYTGPVTRRASAEKRNLESAAASVSAERRRSAGPRPVPIHLPYARAQLPVLAAIMLSDPVRAGSTIHLPMPHPKAWAETAAYVYTGEEQLLSRQVKANIWYLGGKV